MNTYTITHPINTDPPNTMYWNPPQTATRQIPHKCPICDGTGTVPNGFYNKFSSCSTTITPEQCRSCSGSGILWAQEIITN